MGTDYYFLCLDCREYWDMGKVPGVARFLPALKERHKNHRVLIFSDSDEIATLLSPYYSQADIPYERKNCYKEEEFMNLPPAAEWKVNFTIPEVYGRSPEALMWAYGEVHRVILDRNPKLAEMEREQERQRTEVQRQIQKLQESGAGIVEGMDDDDPEADRIYREAFRKAKDRAKEENPSANKSRS